MVVGTFVLKEPRIFRAHSSYARWYDDVEVAPCEAPIYAQVDPRGKVVDDSVCVELTGCVVASDWSPCFGGVPVADGRNKNLGQITKVYLRPYAHAIAEAICKQRASEWRLNPEFEARPIEFLGPLDGRAKTTYQIHKK